MRVAVTVICLSIGCLLVTSRVRASIDTPAADDARSDGRASFQLELRVADSDPGKPSNGNPADGRCDQASRLTTDQQEAALQEVIVTANKRVENLKDVPTAISVIDGAQIAEHHIDDVEDITRIVPGLNFSTAGGEGQDSLSIRGISSNVGSQTVGIYLDDVPLLTTDSYEGVSIPKMLDMSRVEVLKACKARCMALGSGRHGALHLQSASAQRIPRTTPAVNYRTPRWRTASNT